MSLKHGLLGFLFYDTMSGYDLNKTFNDSLQFFWTAQTSQIYRDLTNLEKSGLLTSEQEVQIGKPNKKNYTITNKGKDEFLHWLNNYNFSKESRFREAMLMRVFFSSLGDTCTLIKGLHDYISTNQSYLTEHENVKSLIKKYASKNDEAQKSKVYWDITHLRGELQAKSNIEWAEKSLEMLKSEGLL